MKPERPLSGVQLKQDNSSANKTTCFNVSKEGQVISNNAMFLFAKVNLRR